MGKNKRIKLTDGLGIFISLSLSGSTGVFSIVCKLVSKTVRSNSIRVYDGSTASSNHGPYTTFRVENSKFERCTGGRIKFLDVCFFFGQITTEWCWPDLRVEEHQQPDSESISRNAHHRRSTIGRNLTLGSSSSSRIINGQIPRNSPLGSTDRLGGLIQLGSHIQIMNRRLPSIHGIQTNKRVDLKICEV